MNHGAKQIKDCAINVRNQSPNNEDKILSYCEHSIRKPHILLHQQIRKREY